MHVFLDESGNHTIDPEHVEVLYGIFVLCAVCFEEEAYQTFDTEFRAFKKRVLGSEDYILHTAEITRPKKSRDPIAAKFFDQGFRTQFYQELNELIDRSEFKVIASVIQKKEMVLRLGESTSDPYIYSFDFILNRVLRYCKGEQCNIYPEKRRPNEDNKLELAMLHAKISGTTFFKGAEVTERVREFAMRDKKENISGNQLADLIVTPIGRNVLGKAPKPAGNEILVSSFKRKMAHDDYAVFP